MAAFNELTAPQLARLIGLPDPPIIIDVRTDEDFPADPRSIPGSQRRSHQDCGLWASEFVGRRVVVFCQRG